MPCLYVYNKVDQISLEEVNRIARQPHSIVVSCNMKLNLDYLLETLWRYLAFIRVYTKKPGQPPDFEDCLILRRGVSVEHVCHSIHRTLAQVFKYALVWVSLLISACGSHDDCIIVGNEYEVQSPASRPASYCPRRRRHPDCQKVKKNALLLHWLRSNTMEDILVPHKRFAIWTSISGQRRKKTQYSGEPVFVVYLVSL